MIDVLLACGPVKVPDRMAYFEFIQSKSHPSLVFRVYLQRDYLERSK